MLVSSEMDLKTFKGVNMRYIGLVIVCGLLSSCSLGWQEVDRLIHVCESYGLASRSVKNERGLVVEVQCYDSRVNAWFDASTIVEKKQEK